ncbi:hypothetical protein [Methanolobus chelungpuianus]|nr:hypothetical protein [Methanolobus chelungpuianus]
MELGNMDLSILIVDKLKKNWKAELRMISCMQDQLDTQESAGIPE